MVMMAYLAGLATTPALVAGVVAGMTWWRALRRSEGHTDGPLILTPVTPPRPSPPQDRPRINRVSRASVPARRSVRGRRHWMEE